MILYCLERKLKAAREGYLEEGIFRLAGNDHSIQEIQMLLNAGSYDSVSLPICGVHECTAIIKVLSILSFFFFFSYLNFFIQF